MDGNGRWAQQRHRPRIIGHRAGARAVKACVEFCLDNGVEALTLFAFSSENWGRPQDEVGALMKLFLNALEREVDELDRRGVRVRFIGERERFCEAIRAQMAAAESRTRGNSRLHLTVAPQHLNPHQVVHGAVVYAMADTGMGAALYPTLAAGEICATIEIKINYFKPVSAGALSCITQVVNRGRTVANLESRLFVGDTLVVDGGLVNASLGVSIDA